MKSIKLLVLAIFIISIGCHKDNEIKVSEEMIDVGGYELYTLFEGEGDKTVIFESGLGNGSEVWFAKETFQNSSEFAQAIAYNRAGYAPSEDGIEPRNVEQMEMELSIIIEEKSKNRKVVLVGHSLGGMIIRDYAIKNPEKVAGLVFVDPSHEAFLTLTQEEEDELVQKMIDANGENAIAGKEAAQLIENLEYLHTLPTLPDVPTVVLTSTKIVPGSNAEDKQKWYEAHKKLGEGVSDFKHIATESSGHYIMIDEPDLVLNAIREIVEK